MLGKICVTFVAIFNALTVYGLVRISGQGTHRLLPRVYMVEFEPSNLIHVDHRRTIREHLQLIGYSEEHISFRTSTKTRLFHGHSFEIRADYERSYFEDHIVHMPGVVNIYRVSN